MYFRGYHQVSRFQYRDFCLIIAHNSIDSILVEVFLPQNQSALNGILEFCKHNQSQTGDKLSLLSIAGPSLGFQKAAAELVAKGLIKQDGRVFSIHRVVQEAVNVSMKVWNRMFLTFE